MLKKSYTYTFQTFFGSVPNINVLKTYAIWNNLSVYIHIRFKYLPTCTKLYQGFEVNLFIIHRKVYREIMLSKVLVGWGQRKASTKVPVRKQNDKLSILCLATVTHLVTYCWNFLWSPLVTVMPVKIMCKWS